MRIPSYDDLTPGIPDEIDAKSASQLALFLQTASVGAAHQPPADHTAGQPAVDDTASSVCATTWAAREPALQATPLYACLRTANCEPRTEPLTANCELPTLLAIARDFSPRVMVASEREVLLDVSGLGRLIGTPPAIAAALARALFDAGLEATVALAATQTAARLLATQAPLDAARGRPLDAARGRRCRWLVRPHQVCARAPLGHERRPSHVYQSVYRLELCRFHERRAPGAVVRTCKFRACVGWGTNHARAARVVHAVSGRSCCRRP